MIIPTQDYASIVRQLDLIMIPYYDRGSETASARPKNVPIGFVSVLYLKMMNSLRTVPVLSVPV